MVGLSSISQIWEKLHTYYASQLRAKTKKLKVLLRTPKRNRTINAYILGTKKIVATLAAIGAPISTKEHIEVLLDGLSEEYEAFITLVLTRVDPYTVEKIEALLLSQEERLEKFKITESLRVNLSSASSFLTKTPRNQFFGSFNKSNN